MRRHPALDSCRASGWKPPNPRVRRREASDPHAGEWRRAACPDAVVADGRPRHGLRCAHPTTPPGTRANVNPGMPAGTQAPGAGLGWHPSRVQRVMGIGDRWHRFAQPPATGCETFGSEQGIPCGPSFVGARRHSPAWGSPGFLERVNGCGPLDPSVCQFIRVRGRSREPKNFLRGDQGSSHPGKARARTRVQPHGWTWTGFPGVLGGWGRTRRPRHGSSPASIPSSGMGPG